ncbi:MAG: class I SAM-dependent methyltransferase [Candidatus Latescibacteria bacterium]|jgi:SAM-dependent methyltransferase|nr:class I SAM-dependent methyltransferase [Candidatus Latescibacterota bacterium]
MAPEQSTDPWYRRFFGREYLEFDEHPETDTEVTFILEVLAPGPGTKILDVGCGYGRHLIPLGLEGCSVVGLDLSPVMISAARNGAARSGIGTALVRADMASIPFSGAFDAALSLFSTFGYFETEDQNFRVLKDVSDALAPGGRLLIETANRDFLIRHLTPAQVYRPGGMLVLEERQFDSLTSRSRVDVTVFQDGEETHLYHSIRLYTFTELQMLLSATDLETQAVWGDYRGSGYTTDSPQMIVLAAKI